MCEQNGIELQLQRVELQNHQNAVEPDAIRPAGRGRLKILLYHSFFVRLGEDFQKGGAMTISLEYLKASAFQCAKTADGMRLGQVLKSEIARGSGLTSRHGLPQPALIQIATRSRR